MKIRKFIRHFVPFAAPLAEIGKYVATTGQIVRREKIMQLQFAAAATFYFLSKAAFYEAGQIGVLSVNILFLLIELFFFHIGFRQNRTGVLAFSSAAFAVAAGLSAWISASILITGA